METKKVLDFYIYPNIDRMELLKELTPLDKGEYLSLICPECKKRKAYIYKTGIYIKCNRKNKCFYSESIWDYAQKSKGLSNQETLFELARLANYSLDINKKYSDEQAIKARKKADILEMALSLFKEELFSQNGKEVLQYLNNRKYSNKEIKSMELGFFVPQLELEACLKNFNRNEIYESGLKLKGLGSIYQLAIPYRNSIGRLKGFIVRTIKNIDPKYFYTSGLKRDTLFNLHQSIREKNLTIVEGFLDVLIAKERNIKGVVATGSNYFSQVQFDNLLKYGDKNIILALDNDEAGQAGTEQTLKLKRLDNIKFFIAEYPENYKDMDELIREEGIKATKTILQNAISETKWMARRIINRQDITTDIGFNEALEEAINYEQTIGDPLESKIFMANIAKGLNISSELLKPKLQDCQEKKLIENLKKGYKSFFRDGENLLKDDKLEDVKELLEQKMKEVKSMSFIKTILPYTLDDLIEDVKQTKEGLKTGYKALDKFVTIPEEAITIIAGRPSHGKTTFLLNMYLNMIEAYKDKTFVYFSYEETRKQLGLKILNIIAGVAIDEKKNILELSKYLKGEHILSNDKGALIEDAKRKLESYMQSKRLLLIDQPFYLDELENCLNFLSQKYEIGAIFIDYIQKIKTKKGFPMRQLQLQKISQSILEIAKTLKLPVILGAQLGRDKSKNKVRLDNLREAGDIEQDANLVLGVVNKSMLEKENEEEEETFERVVELEIKILKNRNGVANKSIELEFDRPVLKIRERKEISDMRDLWSGKR
jgi:DNA primase catalytic core